MAVESALVLAEEVDKAATIEAGLEAYQDRRYDRCRDVVETSVAAGRIQLQGGTPEQIGELMGAALHRLAGEF